MAQNIPIYIPTYIGDQNYGPARVLPRLLFYNGNVECQTYYLQGTTGPQSVGFPVSYVELNNFPYFDNYSAETGSFPTTGSKSLLFFNEDSLYGQTPTSSLYSEYWDDYVQLLYNPRTRLLNATAIIPLADYFKIELNDIVEFRGEYWHLRYINDYNLKNGECVIQLLGPIFPAAVPFASDIPVPEDICCTPTITSITQSGINIDIAFTLPGDGNCLSCNATTIQSSTDNINWGNNNTAGCTSPRTIPAPTGSIYYRIIQNCSGSVVSTPSNSFLFVPTTTTTSTTTTTAPPPVYCFDVLNSDVYPVTAGNDSTSGSLINDSGETMYIWGKFNSGGNSSGPITTDTVTIDGSTTLTFTATISSSGQTVYTDTAYTMSACDLVQVVLSKQDNLTSGASLRLAYSLASDATKVDINEGGTGCCTTTTTTTTTTSTTTTTTTTIPTYYYYSVKKYDCGNSCAYVSPDLIARSTNTLSTTNGYYYNPSGDGYVYQVQSEITPEPMSYDVDLSSAPSNAVCSVACVI